eukprot:TRINITY_DN67889_c2_g1_i1.p1 TRINITY_DN67889_c2_g1~~TRINITY_DN67889_c2_g1_i1.p1  ORF type:complete len:865 (-),score=139.45 TRINITY_DN67889_c2_g1_i1:75-2606(-)
MTTSSFVAATPPHQQFNNNTLPGSVQQQPQPQPDQPSPSSPHPTPQKIPNCGAGGSTHQQLPHPQQQSQQDAQDTTNTIKHQAPPPALHYDVTPPPPSPQSPTTGGGGGGGGTNVSIHSQLQQSNHHDTTLNVSAISQQPQTTMFDMPVPAPVVVQNTQQQIPQPVTPQKKKEKQPTDKEKGDKRQPAAEENGQTTDHNTTNNQPQQVPHKHHHHHHASNQAETTDRRVTPTPEAAPSTTPTQDNSHASTPSPHLTMSMTTSMPSLPDDFNPNGPGSILGLGDTTQSTQDTTEQSCWQPNTPVNNITTGPVAMPLSPPENSALQMVDSTTAYKEGWNPANQIAGPMPDSPTGHWPHSQSDFDTMHTNPIFGSRNSGGTKIDVNAIRSATRSPSTRCITPTLNLHQTENGYSSDSALTPGGCSVNINTTSFSCGGVLGTMHEALPPALLRATREVVNGTREAAVVDVSVAETTLANVRRESIGGGAQQVPPSQREILSNMLQHTSNAISAPRSIPTATTTPKPPRGSLGSTPTNPPPTTTSRVSPPPPAPIVTLGTTSPPRSVHQPPAVFPVGGGAPPLRPLLPPASTTDSKKAHLRKQIALLEQTKRETEMRFLGDPRWNELKFQPDPFVNPTGPSIGNYSHQGLPPSPPSVLVPPHHMTSQSPMRDTRDYMAAYYPTQSSYPTSAPTATTTPRGLTPHPTTMAAHGTNNQPPLQPISTSNTGLDPSNPYNSLYTTPHAHPTMMNTHATRLPGTAPNRRDTGGSYSSPLRQPSPYTSPLRSRDSFGDNMQVAVAIDYPSRCQPTPPRSPSMTNYHNTTSTSPTATKYHLPVYDTCGKKHAQDA